MSLLRNARVYVPGARFRCFYELNCDIKRDTAILSWGYFQLWSCHEELSIQRSVIVLVRPLYSRVGQVLFTSIRELSRDITVSWWRDQGDSWLGSSQETLTRLHSSNRTKHCRIPDQFRHIHHTMRPTIFTALRTSVTVSPLHSPIT